MIRALSLFLCAATALLGCSETRAGEPSCTPGEVDACVCESGLPGTGVCLADGMRIACDCEGSATVCTPSGSVSSCECPGGGLGSRACLADGSHGRCRCGTAVGQPDGPPDDDVEQDPVPSRALAQRCCHELGTCFNIEFVGAENGPLFESRGCLPEDEMLCVPDAFAHPAGFELQPCRSTAGAEGRCLIDCLAGGEDLAGFPRGLCDPYHRCAPCFDPFTGEDTGLCYLSLDPGPREPPLVFASCCEDRGTCLPTDAVPEDQRELLGPDTCTQDTTSLCTPDELLEDNYVPASCAGAADLEGRCLSNCLPLVTEQADVLARGNCDDGHACVPCYDPFSGEETGVCSFPGDPGPAGPATPFARCCQDRGTCVPDELIAGDQREQLGRDSCTGEDDLCTPDELLEDDYVPPHCHGGGDLEGRCLSNCLPLVAEQGDRISQGGCDEGNACVPCYDPFSGEATGVCSFPGDPGPTEPFVPFPSCCEIDGVDEGTCVPVDLLPEDQVENLQQDTCPSDAERCVPQSLLDDPDAPLPVCDAGFLGEGRCLKECLVDDGMSFLLSQGSCESGDLCVPCSIFGDPTGVCNAP